MLHRQPHEGPDYGHITDRIEKKKAQHLAGFKPTTSLSPVACSTAVLQPLHSSMGLTFVQIITKVSRLRDSKTVLTEACDHRQHQLQNCSAVETSFEESFDLGFGDDRWRFDEKRAESRIVFECISDFDPVFWKKTLFYNLFCQAGANRDKKKARYGMKTSEIELRRSVVVVVIAEL